jgi:hypothetical protein
VKFKDRPFLIENLRICNISINSGEIRFRRGAIVSLADENTLSQGTAEAWIGMMSMAREKIVGKRL